LLDKLMPPELHRFLLEPELHRFLLEEQQL
jgi:hypothetical protein